MANPRTLTVAAAAAAAVVLTPANAAAAANLRGSALGRLLQDGSCGNAVICPEGTCCSQNGFCGGQAGTDDAWCGAGCQPEFTPDGGCAGEDGATPAPETEPPTTAGSPVPTVPSTGTGASKYITAEMWDTMFPLLQDSTCTGAGFYTYDAFIAAAAAFPDFATASANDDTNAREVAAFLAQASQETTGAAEGDYTGGLCWLDEGGATPTAELYCDAASTLYPCADGESYHGRGPLQLSWNFNYGPAGEALGVDLLGNPAAVLADAQFAFETSLWFWFNGAAPSCHDAMVGDTPTGAAGFGAVTDIINGGVLECGNGVAERSAAEQTKIGYFNTYEEAMGLVVTPAEDASCANINVL